MPIHLWAVISDTRQSVAEIVIVNFTTWRIGHDDSCLLNPGDHPFLQHQTSVSYRDARIVTLAQLEDLENRGLITPKENLSPDILAKIREEARISPFAKLKIREILGKQNLI